MTDVVTLCSSSQQHVMAGFVDCLARGAHALERDWQIVEWRLRITRGVLDRQACNTRGNAAGDAVSDILWRQPISGHEISTHRKINCRDCGNMCKAPLATDDEIVAGVGKPLRECEAGAGRREGRESQVLKIPRGTHIPWIRNDETSSLMERAERFAPCDQRGRELRLRCVNNAWY